MPLEPGTRFGSFTVVAAVGAGGMGEVYRARDTALDRDVALKILPAAFAADPERLHFAREAKTVAVLNHPHIAHIHGIGQSDGGVRALVMEFIDGDDPSDGIVGRRNPGRAGLNLSPSQNCGPRRLQPARANHSD